MAPVDARRRREDRWNLFRGWRRDLLTRRLMPVIGRMLPRLGDTEREALEAGTVWWDGDAAFAETLMLHAESEEQALYPTTLLIGEYLELRRRPER